MRISIFISGVSGGGAERVTCGLANFLHKHSHSVELITMSDEEATYPLDSGINRVCLLKRDERKNFIIDQVKRITRLKKYMKTSSAEKYLVMLPIPTIMMLLLHKSTSSPIIVSERNDPNSMPKIQQYILNRLSKRATGYVFQTDEAAQYYSKFINDIPYEVIPNAINEEILRERIDIKERKKEIVAVGRLSPQKNFKLLIETFSELLNSIPGYQLMIFGDGPMKSELEKAINDKGLKGKVILRGFSKKIATDIVSASLYVLSSDYEGMPNSLIEAMALGLPCIATDCPIGGPRYLIKNEYNGLLVPVNNKVELKKAMEVLLKDSTKAKLFGERAKHIAIDLSPTNIYSRWEEYLSRVV